MIISQPVETPDDEIFKKCRKLHSANWECDIFIRLSLSSSLVILKKNINQHFVRLNLIIYF